jgi:hypothetical protein
MSSSSGHHHMTGGNNTGNNYHQRHYQQHQQTQHQHFQSQLSVANSQARLEQLFDEQDHKRCSEGNRKALLAENLDQLRGLTKVLEADDWKYHSSSGSNSIGGAMSRGSSAPRTASSSNDSSNNNT